MSLAHRAKVLFASLLLLALAPHISQAQIRGRPMVQPNYGWWFSGGAAGVVLGDINDGHTGSKWVFGGDPLWQMRGTLEKALDQASTFGVTVGYGVVDVTLSPLNTTPVPVPAGTVCDTGCAADTELWTAMAQFRSGGGPGFHTFFEAQGGVTGFRNLKTKDTREAIGTKTQQLDLSGTIGFGVGYSLSDGLAVGLVQDFGIGFHAKDNLPDGAGRTWRVRTTRAALRFHF